MHPADSPEPARRSGPPFAAGRWLPLLVVVVILGGWWWIESRPGDPPLDPPLAPSRSEQKSVPAPVLPGDGVLSGYGDPEVEPIEDLRKVHRVLTGYFSVVKDNSRFPIGGNADLAEALRGRNAAGEVFVSPEHPVFSEEGLLLDRWGQPLIIHPEAWREIEIRSAGPDGIAYNGDDLILAPNGNTVDP